MCENGRMTIVCPAGKILDIKGAMYGRKVSGDVACGHSSINDLNCEGQNDLQVLKEHCDRLGTCEIGASNLVFGDPCVGTYKYLQVQYVCAEGDLEGDSMER